MRFRAKEPHSTIPKLDLIPLLNVMMVVLAFFILISLSLSTVGDRIEVQLPTREAGNGAEEDLGENSVIVRLNSEEQFIVDEKVLNKSEILISVDRHLRENPETIVFLVADPDVPYERVIAALKTMQEIDSDRISLGIFAN